MVDRADAEASPGVPDVRVPPPWARAGAALARWSGPPRPYVLTRWLVVRLLGVVYLAAFAGLVAQGPALLGDHGLTPVGPYLERLAADGQGPWEVPSVLWWGASDAAITGWAWLGVALAGLVVLGLANLPILLALWVIYGSFTRVGQLWFAFGWELQLLETTLLVAALVHPWDPRPLRAPAPPRVAIVLLRWLALRVMLGAGLIKLRGDACWTELTCLAWHFETQPLPGPLSPLLHALPASALAAGGGLTLVVELALPLCVFGPRPLRLVAAGGMGAFQLILIASGNLAFFNWITLVAIAACLDDDALRRVLPRRARVWLDAPARAARPPGRGARWLAGGLALVVAVRSVPVIENLLSPRQAMNRAYDRLALVNTYGAFGTVGRVRYELVIEGTRDPDPAAATWRAYTLPCQPGPLDRRPCVLGPYHRRADWLMWFAAMAERPRDPWVLHLVWKLLDGDRRVRELLAHDPFDGAPPTWVRIRRFRYTLAPPGAPTWWRRDEGREWLRPVSLLDDELRAALARFGWPSPPLRGGAGAG